MTRRRERWSAVAVVLLLTLVGPAAAQAPLPPGDEPPPTALSRLATAGDAEKHPGAASVVVYEETVNRVDERGVTTSDSYVLSKVLTASGCRDLAVLRWGFDPQSSAVEVLEVNLLRGQERIPVPVAGVLETPAPQAAIYWSDRVKLLQLPRLAVGDGVEVRTRRRGFTYALLDGARGTGAAAGDDRFVPPMPGEYFDVVLFQAPTPTLEKRYELHLPAGKRLHSRVYNGALYSSTSYSADESVFAWWGFDLPPIPDEPGQPDDPDLVTKVVLATVESWQAKSRWFFQLNDPQLASTPEIDAKVRAVLDAAGVAAGTDADKAEALVHWVAQNIRYSGQTMGHGEGYTLHPGSMIFEQRSGVCKDIAAMLITMMRSAGIPTYGAMTMAGSRIEEVPADQFNHCVVARQTEGGFVMYDPTWVPFNNDIWSKLETEQHYLVGSPAGETLSRIPYSPPSESPLEVRHRARLATDGTLAGTVRLSARGASDGRLRGLVAQTPVPELPARLAALLAPGCPRVEVLRFDLRRPDDFSGDMWLELTYRAPELALPVAGGLELESLVLPALLGDRRLLRAGAQSWPEKRDADVLLYATQLVDLVETVELPAGWHASSLPADSTVDETYAAFAGRATTAPGTLEVSARVEVRRRQIPPAGYSGFAAAMKAARDWADARVRVEPKGGA